MTLRAREHGTPRWPFWLLLGAWFCANTPQVAIFTALTWMAEGRSFTHQQRLTADVARILGGEKPTSPIAEKVARAQEQLPAKSKPVAPDGFLLKKITLSLEKTTELLPVALRADRHQEVAWLCPEPRRGAPPHGPPRVSEV
jgi:hypothetical protein